MSPWLRVLGACPRLAVAVDDRRVCDHGQSRQWLDRERPGSGDVELDRVGGWAIGPVVLAIAWRSEPAPLSLVLVTTNVLGWTWIVTVATFELAPP